MTESYDTERDRILCNEIQDTLRHWEHLLTQHREGETEETPDFPGRITRRQGMVLAIVNGLCGRLMPHILQIIPAAGWKTVYEDRSGALWDSPLACWALVEDASGARRVVGLSSCEFGLDGCEDAANFVAYRPPEHTGDETERAV
jgi:hypothetical protein